MHLRVSEPQGDRCWAHCKAHSTGSYTHGSLLQSTGHGGACCWAHCRAHSTGRLLLGTGHGGACCSAHHRAHSTGVAAAGHRAQERLLQGTQHRALYTGVAFHSPTNKAALAFLSIVNFYKIHIKLYYWLCVKNF